MNKKALLNNLIFTAPAGIILGALLSLTQRGSWLIGWLAFSALLIPGLYLLGALWHWAGKNRMLAWILALSFLLRLGLGFATEIILPLAGSGSDTTQAGYIFYDAYRRDMQAWSLAQSDNPTWLAFSKSYSTDQYGGLLALSSLTYRYLSPDSHRSLLVIVLAALTAAAGIALAWKAVLLAWGEKLAAPMAFILAIYPESVLQGSSQMREPFLISFFCMAFLGAAEWTTAHRSAWGWLAGGILGMLLFSPGIAILTLVILAGWVWLRGERLAPDQRKHLRISWRTILVSVAVLVIALVLLWAGLARGSLAGRSLVEVLTSWLQYSSKWDIYLLERNSGWVQKLFNEMPFWLRLPFITGYGLAQPVLPAAIMDPAPWPWKVIGILRATGWYILAPFLVYSLVAILRTPRKYERFAWLWLWIATWTWMVISAIRAGADQWDNPRYRVILLLLQALLTTSAWIRQRETRDPWLVRILGVEAVFLAFFTEWYASRYFGSITRLSFGIMVLAIVGISALIVLGGWWWDRRKARALGA